MADYIWVIEIMIDGWVQKGYTNIDMVSRFGKKKKKKKNQSSKQQKLNFSNWLHPQVYFCRFVKKQPLNQTTP